MQSFRYKHQRIVGAFARMCHILRDRLPYSTMMRFGSDTAFHDVCLVLLYKTRQLLQLTIKKMSSYFRPMLLLEFQPPTPNVSDVRVRLDRALEPLTGFLDLALGPKESGNSADDQRVVRRLAEGIRRLRLACWAGLGPDSHGPQQARSRAVLQT